MHWRGHLLLWCTLTLLAAGCATRPAKKTTEAGTGPTGTPRTAQRNSPTKAPVAAEVEPQPPVDLWDRLRAGFELGDRSRPEVQRWIVYYSAHSRGVTTTLSRAEPFLWRIVENVDKRGMPMEIALLPAVESAFNPFAHSSGSASGLWQFIPGTAKRFGLQRDWWYDGRRDIVRSTKAALDYLQYLDNMFDGNWVLAIAAYNAGEGRVRAAIQFNRERHRPTDFWDLELPSETRDYVPKLLALAALVDQPQRYGLVLPDMPNEPRLAIVQLPAQIDLALAAQLAGIPVAELRGLNPGFKRWATDPNGAHRLLIPRDRVQRFTARLAKVPASRLVTWRRHVIVGGDTLSEIATRYGSSVALLKRVNHLSSSRIRIGRTLLIPSAHDELSATALAAVDAVNGAGAAPIQPTEYKVHRGDSLWTIARRYDTTVDDLRRWNGLPADAILRPGQSLHIPAVGQDAERTLYYSVRSGDSLSAIARRYGVNVDDLRRWNGLDGDHYIRPGQRLKVKVELERTVANQG